MLCFFIENIFAFEIQHYYIVSQMANKCQLEIEFNSGTNFTLVLANKNL